MRFVAIGLAVIIGLGLFVFAGGEIMAPVSIVTVVFLVGYGGFRLAKHLRSTRSA